MRLCKGVAQVSEAPKCPVVTIGNFDGVHKGHREIIRLAVAKAQQLRGQSVIYTFRPHPQVVLHPEKLLKLLNTYDERIELFEEQGPDWVVEEPFSRDFSTIPAQKFFADTLIGKLGAKAIVVGHDFGFGKDRQGHLDTLQALCASSRVELTVVPPLHVSGKVVSSSKIRASLESAKIEEANDDLGYAFSYSGVVVRGDGRGRKIGFPTANLQLEPKLELPRGVYLTQAELEGGTKVLSVTNIGVRPTFQQEAVNPLAPQMRVHVECHLLDHQSDLYGKRIKLKFFSHLREEKKFASVDALIAQIQEDVASVRARGIPSLA
jgi:riboflavin kinase/FMN adenylyltransferase